MATSIKELAPQAIWHNFYLLTQVPRPSGHLQKVQEFLLNWAKERSIEAFKDNAENIVMRKPATPGMEDRKMQSCRPTWIWCHRKPMRAHMSLRQTP